MTNTDKLSSEKQVEEKSFLSVIVHSFFIVPFLIAVFCVLLFTGVNLLTRENRTLYDYLEDVKTGGLSKRWQGAFELSKILANPKQLTNDQRFFEELSKAFEQSKHDDPRVRQYLALAMGRTGIKDFVVPLTEDLENEKEASLPSIIYALGMIADSSALDKLYQYIDHPDGRIRSLTIASIGNIASSSSVPILQKALLDMEDNVKWAAAISLAQLKDNSGKDVLLQLMSRDYLESFPEVDQSEQTNLIVKAIEVSGYLNSAELKEKVAELSKTDKNMKVRNAAFKALENNL